MSGGGSPTDLVERLYAALDADDVDGMVALCADDVEVAYPAAGRLPYGGTWLGREDFVAFLEAHESAEEILDFEPESMTPNGDTVMVLGTFRGRSRPSGREWTTRFVHVMTVRDDRLRRWESIFDTAAAISAR